MNETMVWDQERLGALDIYFSGPTVLLARICDELNVARIINSMVTWDETRWNVSPGHLAVALIINALVDRKPLSQVEEFYKNRDLELLFGRDLQAKNFNDDALGRMLDRVFAVDKVRLVQSIALCAVNREGLEVRTVHADTTSVSVYGEYEPPSDDEPSLAKELGLEAVQIRHGFSKQKRPDLKQFTAGLVVSEHGIPMMGTIGDGNLNDKVWNMEILDGIRECFLDPKRIIYIADSALMTKKNLRRLTEDGIRFVSRVPENFGVTASVKAKAFAEGKWRFVGALANSAKAATYQLASFHDTIGDTPYRFVVVRSSALDKRKANKLERTVAAEEKELLALAKTVAKQTFNCKEDAEAELQRLQAHAEKGLHRVKGQVVRKTRYLRPPGRPKLKAEYPSVTTYHLELRIQRPTQEVRGAWLERESAFVLITNLADDVWDDLEILEMYKDQTKVEQGFRVFKHPIMDQGTLFKNPERVEAFGYLAIIALIVAAVLQHRVRANLQREKTTVRLNLQERKTDRPTSVALLKELNSLCVVRHRLPSGYTYRFFNLGLRDEHARILTLAGYSPSVYLEPADTG